MWKYILIVLGLGIDLGQMVGCLSFNWCISYSIPGQLKYIPTQVNSAVIQVCKSFSEVLKVQSIIKYVCDKEESNTKITVI